MIPHLCSPTDFRKHNSPDRSQGTNPLAHQKPVEMPCIHTWPYNRLTEAFEFEWHKSTESCTWKIVTSQNGRTEFQITSLAQL